MDLPRVAKRMGTAALVTGVVLAVLGTVWGRWAMWRLRLGAHGGAPRARRSAWRGRRAIVS